MEILGHLDYDIDITDLDCNMTRIFSRNKHGFIRISITMCLVVFPLYFLYIQPSCSVVSIL